MQLSFFKKSSTITPNQARCWRCNEFFPISDIEVFDTRYSDGNIGTYQACHACASVIRKESGI